MINLTIGCLIATSYSQSQTIESKKSKTTKNGPQMEQVQLKENYYKRMQRIAEKEKMKSLDSQAEKKVAVRIMEKTNHQSKNKSSQNAKPKQILNLKRPYNFGQGKEKFFSKTETRKKLHRVEGFAPREEMKKIDVHPQVSEEVMIRALGNRKQFHIRSNKTE